MQQDIPQHILDLVARCESAADSVSWEETEILSQFFEDRGFDFLAQKLRKIKAEFEDGKYRVAEDDENVRSVLIQYPDRTIKFLYREGENVDEPLKQFIKKHNLANGDQPGTDYFEEVYEHLHTKILATVSKSSPVKQPVYDHSHLSRRPQDMRCTTKPSGRTSPALTDDSDEIMRPVTPDGESARDVQQALSKLRRAKINDKTSDRNSDSPSRSLSSIPSSSCLPRSSAFPTNASGSAQPKPKFQLKPVKPSPKRPKFGSLSSGAPAPPTEEKSETTMTSSASWDFSSTSLPAKPYRPKRSSKKRKRAKKEIRARDIVEMVHATNYDGMIARVKRYGMTEADLDTIEQRFDLWSKCVATEIGSLNRGSRRSYMFDSFDDDDYSFEQLGGLDEEAIVGSRIEMDEDLSKYFGHNAKVWARTPNVKYFRKGAVIATKENLVRVSFYDRRSPNDKWFEVMHYSASIRRSQPPIKFIHIDSDDFRFSYDEMVEDIDADAAAVDALQSFTQIMDMYNRMQSGRGEPQFQEPRDEPRRKKSKMTKKIAGRGYSLQSDDVFSFETKDPFEFFDDPMEDVASAPFVLDDGAPKIQVRIRLKTGAVVPAEFNTTHTVGDIKSFLASEHNVFGTYKLQLMGFPPKQLSVDEESVAGLDKCQIALR